MERRKLAYFFSIATAAFVTFCVMCAISPAAQRLTWAEVGVLGVLLLATWTVPSAASRIVAAADRDSVERKAGKVAGVVQVIGATGIIILFASQYRGVQQGSGLHMLFAGFFYLGSLGWFYIVWRFGASMSENG